MAAYDVEVQTLFWSNLIPIVLAIFSVILLKSYFKKWYQMIYAAFMERFVVKYNKRLNHRKQELFTKLSDLTYDGKKDRRKLTILEIGAGTGANFKYFPESTSVICLDPNPYFQSYLQNNSNQFPHVHLKDFIIGSAEDLSIIPNDSIDAVVCTLVLCSVSDIDLCVKEIKRILRKVTINIVVVDQFTPVYLFTPTLNFLKDL